MSAPGAKPGMFRNMYSAGILNCSRLSRSRNSGFMNSYQRLVSAVGIDSIRSMTPIPVGMGIARLLRLPFCQRRP